jgi:hypothetical protein
MASVGADEVVTATEFIALQTFQELEAAVAQTRGCTYGCSMSDVRPIANKEVFHVVGIMQPIYSCRTCAAATGVNIGVCEPCSLRCHAEHDLIEVGTRRQFRCDCPTTRSSVPCCAGGPATPVAPNTENRYGQNFEGRFCTCGRPYESARDEMYQARALSILSQNVAFVLPVHKYTSANFSRLRAHSALHAMNGTTISTYLVAFLCLLSSMAGWCVRHALAASLT